MLNLLAHFLLLFVDPTDVAALQRTMGWEAVSANATAETLVAARIAGQAYRLDPNLLLSIGFHEVRTESATSKSKSCVEIIGVGTTTCQPTTTLDNYLACAAHVRGWIDAMHGNERWGLVGVVGGYALLEKCTHGPVWIREGVDTCKTPEVFWWRARLIKRELSRSVRHAI